MANIYKGEFQDYEGNVVYPHTSADVVFTTDGENVQQKLNQIGKGLDGVTGRTDSPEVDDSNILATSKAVHQLNASLNYSLEEINTNKKWIDGKPIYRKYVKGSTIIDATSRQMNFSHNIPGIDVVTNYIAFYRDTRTDTIHSGGNISGNLTGSQNFISFFSCDKTGYRFYRTIPNGWYSEGYFTVDILVEYTKL